MTHTIVSTDDACYMQMKPRTIKELIGCRKILVTGNGANFSVYSDFCREFTNRSFDSVNFFHKRVHYRIPPGFKWNRVCDDISITNFLGV